ncbi:MAG: hypothetical protein KC503_05275 [Myxococcales bacterium]|nr:hypothetical protein [Myxococcales bacterium]
MPAFAQSGSGTSGSGSASGSGSSASGSGSAASTSEKAPAKTSDGGAMTRGSKLKPSPGGIARFKGLLGYALVLVICFALSNNRSKINWRTVGWGLALQAAFALIVLNPVVGQFFFDNVDAGVRKLLGFADRGIDFLFQSTTPHKMTFVNDAGKMVTDTFIGRMSPALKSVAFSVLPTVIFFSSIITLLYHLGVMQFVVKGMARAFAFLTRTSGAESLSCTANIFVGQTEAPLLIKPFIHDMTKSELMTVMTGGFATVAGGILAIYVGMLRSIKGIAGHLVTASLMAAPASLAVSKLLYPETEQPTTAGTVAVSVERPDSNAIEAAARGASEGMTLFLNIAAMLIAFVGIMAMINAFLGLFGLSVELLLGWILSPLAWAMGTPWEDATKLGQLLGKKLVLTELLAYLDLKSMVSGATAVLSARTAVIASYALCGFANVASIGIQIGGIGAMAPSRRGDLARLGIRAMFAGALVSCLSGAVAGMLV